MLIRYVQPVDSDLFDERLELLLAEHAAPATKVEVRHLALRPGLAGPMLAPAPLSVRTTLAACALASSVSFSASTVSSPQRVVIFINVVGCGTRPPCPTRQNRDHETESATSRHTVSYDSR